MQLQHLMSELQIHCAPLWMSVPVVDSCQNLLYSVVEQITIVLGLPVSSASFPVGANSSYGLVARLSNCSFRHINMSNALLM